MAEGLAVFLILLYDIVIALVAGFFIYCLFARRVIATSGWTYRDRSPEQYRRKMFGFGMVLLLLVVIRLLPLPF